MRGTSVTAARWIALLLPLTLIGGALGSQYLGGLFPCELCHWQRWPLYLAIVFAAAAFVVPRRVTRRALILLAALLIGISGVIGVYHAGVEYGFWEGITQCTATVAVGGGPDAVMEQLMRAPMIRCDVPQWTLLGVSLAGWNALFSLSGAALIIWLMVRRRV